MRRLRRKNKGFSFIELVLVISLLGILVILYTESVGELSNVSIDAASRKVQSDIRYAQQLAISNNTVYGADFTAGGGYEVYMGSPGNPVVDPTSRENMINDLSAFEGVSIANNYRAEFDGFGVPVIGGDGQVRLVVDAGGEKTVSVVANTGAVEIDYVDYGSGCSCHLCEL